MKKIFLVCFLFFVFCFAQAQNLVPNYSFEIDSICPADYGDIYLATPWFQPAIIVGSSSDAYDSCASSLTTGVPINSQGHQSARTGYGYAGIYLHYLTANWREYIEVPLIDTLISNKGYCIEFYLSLAEISKEATSTVGVYFSRDSLLDSTYHKAINYVTPQFENPASNMLSSKTNWMQVSGTFIATGGERFMTIGNFHTPANTNAINVSGGSDTVAYYYIDDISVTACNVGVEELTIDNEELKLYPNPATTQLIIENGKLIIKEIKIYNVLGESVHQQPITNNQQLTIDTSSFSRGVYFLEVRTDGSTGSPQGKVLRKRFVKE